MTDLKRKRGEIYKMNIIIIISGLVLIGTIIYAIIKAWNTDTYDVTDLSEEEE